MSVPTVVAVNPGSAGARAGLVPGDELLLINGYAVRDIIQYRQLVDEAEVEIVVRRGGLEHDLVVEKPEGSPLGIEVQSALFDQLRTCDNHCSFCFIYQLPPGLRPSLYEKDDDYRLSFLYGNFTTLTRFTEADLERVITEGLSPLNVSIHATDPDVRAALLRNRRGATSLRWLRALLDHGVEIHGQLVICPGLNDGSVLDDTLSTILERYPELASVHAVPLGLSKFNKETGLRVHHRAEAAAVIDTIEQWQPVFLETLSRRVVFAADEYYLMAGRPFPPADVYEDFAQFENGVGMARVLERELSGVHTEPMGVAAGFFAWTDGAPAEGYRAPRVASSIAPPLHGAPSHDDLGHYSAPPARCVGESVANEQAILFRPRPSAPVAVLTGAYGAQVLGQLLPPVLASIGRNDVRIVAVENQFFGGNTAVAGLMVGADLARVLADEPVGHRYLLPDVCLSNGLFLDGTSPRNLPRPVEIIRTDGIALRSALEKR